MKQKEIESQIKTLVKKFYRRQKEQERSNAPRKIIGLQVGEKLHEVLLTDQESRNAVELKKYFVVLPEFSFWSGRERYDKYYKMGQKVANGFCYESQHNTTWLDPKSLRRLLKLT